jgi:hypothetical protein
LHFERVVSKTCPRLLSLFCILENRVDAAENVSRNLQRGWRDTTLV